MSVPVTTAADTRRFDAEYFAPLSDTVLNEAVTGPARLPGVVAQITDRDGLLYSGAAGLRSVHKSEPMNAETVFALFSATKLVTVTALLILWECGSLDLDIPAAHYAPELGALQVLEGFDVDGTPLTRPPKRAITLRMLLLHNAGFGYDFFNTSYRRLTTRLGWPTTLSAQKQALMTPLLFEPGEDWEYGTGIDWCGNIIETAAAQNLGEFCADRLFTPLGMTRTGFIKSPAMSDNCAALHQRTPDGAPTPSSIALPDAPDITMGGHGLYGSITDIMRFLRLWLNDGMGPEGRILRAETIALATQAGLSALSTPLRMHALPAVDRSVTRKAEFFPGLAKSWAFAGMINDAPAPTGRPKGALGWGGLANLYYWLDRENGYAGFWASQIFPFFDTTAYHGFMRFETAFYNHLHREAGT